MSVFNRVFKNARILMAAELLNVATGVATVILLARLLDPSSLGLYSFSYAIGSVLGIACLYGANQLIIREISRSPEKFDILFGNSLVVRSGVAAILSVIVLGALHFMGYSGARYFILCAFILCRVFECFVLMACAFYRGFQEMEHEGTLRLVLNLSSLVFGFPVLLLTHSLAAFAALQCTIFFLGAVWAYRALIRRYSTAPWKSVSVAGARAFLRDGMHFSMYGLLLVLYIQTNTILLGFFHGDYATGIYTAAFRFISAMGMVAMSVNGALLPAISRMTMRDEEHRLRSAYLKSARYLLILASFFSLTLFAFAPVIVPLIYGTKFGEAVLALRIMAFTTLLSFWNSSSSNLLFSIDQEAACLKSLALSVGFVVVINLALLPRFGYLGASVTTLLPEVFYLGLQLRVIKKHFVGISFQDLIVKFSLLIVALLVLAWAIEGLPLWSRIVLFTGGYAGGLYLFKILSMQEIRFLRSQYAPSSDAVAVKV